MGKRSKVLNSAKKTAKTEDPARPIEEESNAVSVIPEVVDSEIEVLPSEAIDLEDEEDVAPSTAITRYDPLTAYLSEISRHRRLDRAEEHELAIRYREHQDLEAARRLVVGTLWLVVKLARDYERAARSLLDLIQEGNMGLMEAVKNFDPHRGIRFPSYAAWWIKAYIIRFVIANWRLVKIGTTQAQRKLFFNLNKEKERLEREGFYPSPKLLAERLDVRESDVIEMEQRLSGGDVSVDTPLSEEGDANLLSILPANQSNAEEIAVSSERKRLIDDSLDEVQASLKPNEHEIFMRRLLPDDQDKATLQDLAETLSLSRERIRQIENRIKEKLKAFLEEKFGEALEQL